MDEAFDTDLTESNHQLCKLCDSNTNQQVCHQLRTHAEHVALPAFAAARRSLISCTYTVLQILASSYTHIAEIHCAAAAAAVIPVTRSQYNKYSHKTTAASGHKYVAAAG